LHQSCLSQLEAIVSFRKRNGGWLSQPFDHGKSLSTDCSQYQRVCGDYTRLGEQLAIFAGATEGLG
jgi:hypothetical protein